MTNKLTTLYTVIFLTNALTVNAATVEVHYEGKVSSLYGDGAGYSVNDSIFGSLFINTSLAPADSNSSNKIGNYYNRNTTDNSAFVTGHTDMDNTRSYDQIYIENDYYSNRDRFYALDYETSSYNDGQGNYGYSTNYLYVQAYDYVLDFITGDSIEQIFDLNAGDAHYMNGQVYSHGYDYKNNVRTNYNYGYASFNLSRLSVGPATASLAVSAVPEPGTITLFALGFVTLMGRKLFTA